VLLAILVAAGPAHAGGYDRAERVRRIERALAALRDTDADTLARADGWVRSLQRGACAAEIALFQLKCVAAAVEARCAAQGSEAARCSAYLDVVAANLLGEEQLVPLGERNDPTGQDARELGRLLHRARARLALDFRLREGAAATDAARAEQIDRYCLQGADESGLAWQTCAASLAWYLRVPTLIVPVAL
jgi:hypothetical protein